MAFISTVYVATNSLQNLYMKTNKCKTSLKLYCNACLVIFILFIIMMTCVTKLIYSRFEFSIVSQFISLVNCIFYINFALFSSQFQLIQMCLKILLLISQNEHTYILLTLYTNLQQTYFCTQKFIVS